MFSLSFPSNTILSCLFFFFFTIGLYFLIVTVIIPTTELVIPTGTQTNKANAKIERQPVGLQLK